MSITQAGKLSKKQLARLREIAQNLEGIENKRIFDYSWLKSYTNFVERLARQYNVQPSAIRIRKQDGMVELMDSTSE